MVPDRSSSRRLWLLPVLGLLPVAGLAVACALLGPAPLRAEGAVAQPPVNVPGFWDPRRRPERPDLSRIKVIRFLTETDYPPFNFSAPDGSPQGFNVDLAR